MGVRRTYVSLSTNNGNEDRGTVDGNVDQAPVRDTACCGKGPMLTLRLILTVSSARM